MKSADFIAVARQLANAAGSGRPLQVSLRRAVSTTYYALFHTICGNAADLLIGKAGPQQSNPEWVLIYRALDHRAAKNACERVRNSQRFPPPIRKFAIEFVQAQQRRLDADYDPSVQFERSRILKGIKDAETAIKAFNAAPAPDRKAFVARLLFRERP